MFKRIIIITILLTFTGCVSSHKVSTLNDYKSYSSYFANFQYDVVVGTPLKKVFTDISLLTSVVFTFDSELSQVVDELDIRLPKLVGLSLDKLLIIMPQVVYPAAEFVYEYESAGKILLKIRYLKSGT